MMVSVRQGLANRGVIADLRRMADTFQASNLSARLPNLAAIDAKVATVRKEATALARFLEIAVMSFEVMEIKRTSVDQLNPKQRPVMSSDMRRAYCSEIDIYFQPNDWVSPLSSLTLRAARRLAQELPAIIQSLQHAGATFVPRYLSSDKNENFFSLVRDKFRIFTFAAFMQHVSSFVWLDSVRQAGYGITGVHICTSRSNNNFRGIEDRIDEALTADMDVVAALKPQLPSKKGAKRALVRKQPSEPFEDAQPDAHPAPSAVAVITSAQRAKFALRWKDISLMLDALGLLPRNNLVSLRSATSRSTCHDFIHKISSILGDRAASLLAANDTHRACRCPIDGCDKSYSNKFAAPLKKHLLSEYLTKVPTVTSSSRPFMVS